MAFIEVYVPYPSGTRGKEAFIIISVSPLFNMDRVRPAIKLILPAFIVPVKLSGLLFFSLQLTIYESLLKNLFFFNQSWLTEISSNH